MFDPQEQVRRLHTRDDARRGLVVDHEGVAFGPDCELVRRLPGGAYRALDKNELALVPRMAKAGADPRQLSRIADALNGGNLVRAQLLGLQLPLAAQEPPSAGGLLKGGYDDQEPRKPNGEWTVGGALATAAEGMGFAEAAIDASAIATAARAALAGVAGSAAGLLAGLVYPSGNWNTYQGTLDGRPDVDYRYDEGHLSLYRTAPDGSRTQLYQGRAGSDGLYRDPQGTVIGSDLGRGFRVDIDRIDAVSDKSPPVTQARAVSTTDEPQVCPDPGPDHPHGASPRAQAYQWQITGLPPGLAIWFNGQVYDGCNPVTGALLEAKGPGYEAMMDLFWWDDTVKDFDELAIRELDNAGGRRVEWHFAEKRVADFMRAHFADLNLTNIDVIYTPPTTIFSPLLKARNYGFRNAVRANVDFPQVAGAAGKRRAVRRANGADDREFRPMRRAARSLV
ncbi:hypothetical protein GCM10011611_43690 [Aliidongia dinghuensis]|uniref:Uncharacterized protein n=1 Tax=Aliidongia dinghuensis TaxID=1867774 RepID=A0A8J2YXN6_9PROT|nr:Tox-REase-5 domain-containing protein [Aliidongia dinghuensis]GGF32770.1 hypothetical protein GCM10011611_43690 [Aliidongia dinghuensis]